jgi:hypothetical protein
MKNLKINRINLLIYKLKIHWIKEKLWLEIVINFRKLKRYLKIYIIIALLKKKTYLRNSICLIKGKILKNVKNNKVKLNLDLRKTDWRISLFNIFYDFLLSLLFTSIILLLNSLFSQFLAIILFILILNTRHY